ncbi:centrosomal protein of 112 kDa-like isoform X2 [Ascaphus truei]|uniref:centrosomal protein of 112 kDa-like isoform X2 n=1 Tax=Ascaphus truei TaxID=8439 RepID=UPI003F5A2F26
MDCALKQQRTVVRSLCVFCFCRHHMSLWDRKELCSIKGRQYIKPSETQAEKVDWQKKRHRYMYSSKLTSRSLSPTQRSDEDNLAMHHTGDHLKKTSSSFDDSDIETRLNSWNLGVSPRIGLGKSGTLRDEQALFRLHEKEIDMKIKAMEAKCHEEKLKLQQKHDGDVQKVRDPYAWGSLAVLMVAWVSPLSIPT